MVLQQREPFIFFSLSLFTVTFRLCVALRAVSLSNEENYCYSDTSSRSKGVIALAMNTTCI